MAPVNAWSILTLLTPTSLPEEMTLDLDSLQYNNTDEKKRSSTFQ